MKISKEKITTKDQDGVEFTFTKHDFEPLLGVYVNRINYNPNTKTSIRSSITVLLSQARFSGLITKEHTVAITEKGLNSIPKRIYDDYKFSFFKSRYYQAAINLFYKKQYLLIIEDKVKFDRCKLANLGVTAVTESEYINAVKHLQINENDQDSVREKLNIQPLSNRKYKVKGRSLVEIKPAVPETEIMINREEIV